ncbi:MAG: C25 family cysteine peptidase, partial [Acidobacteriota bacterium]
MSTPRSIRRCLNLLRFPVIAITMHCCFAAADLSAGTHASSQSADDAWTRALKTYKAKGAWGKTSLRAPELAKKASAHSVRATGQWFRLEVAEDGMVKIDAAYLRAQGVDPASLASIRDIKIFGGSGCALSTAPDARMGDELPQCAVFYADNNGNGRFNDDDYLLFYAQGSTGWDYDHEAGRFRHWINPYSSSNFYFLQIASSGTVKEMPMQQAPASAGSVVTGSVGKIFFDEDKFNFNQSGQMWVGAPMSGNGTTRLITNKLTGYAPGTPLIYRYDLFAQASVQSTFEISEANAVIADVELPAMTIEEIKSTEGEFAREAVGEIAVDPKLPGDRSTVRMTYSAASSNAAGYINWLEIIYQKQLAASNDELTFTSPDQTGSVEYPVTGFSTNAVLGFDVTDLNNVKRLDLQLQQQMGTFRFRDNLTSGTVRSYWIGAPSAYHAPKSTVKLPPSNLHGTGPGAEFIIITHQDFKSEALRLKAHKEALPSGTALSTTVVDVDTIYNEFGNGTPDPTAIR